MCIELAMKLASEAAKAIEEKLEVLTVAIGGAASDTIAEESHKCTDSNRDGKVQGESLHSKLVMREKVLLSKQHPRESELIESFLALHQQKNDYASAIEERLQEASRAKKRQLAFEHERFLLLSTALRKINECIGALYGRIVRNGDCFLSYPTDQVSLFSEGIRMRAQHGNSSWLDVRVILPISYALITHCFSWSRSLNCQVDSRRQQDYR